MPLRRLTRGLLALALLPLLTPLATAAPVITGDTKAGFDIKAEGYEAKVGPDGYLYDLKLHGKEFLLPGVGISRGTCLYQGGLVKITKTTQSGDAIDSEGPLATVRYDFADRVMTWTVTNRSKASMTFFAILPETVAAGSDNAKTYAALPSPHSWADSSWFSENTRLSIRNTGATRQWGWKQNSTVWEAKLAPGETRVIELAAGKPDALDRDGLKGSGIEIGDLRVTSPRELQVFQRAIRTEGQVRVGGKLLVPADSIEVRFIGKDLDGRPLRSEWQAVACSGKDGTFGGIFTVAAGGRHSAELRALKSGKEVAAAKVTQFGVGEVFVGAGQSNSTNCGGSGSKLPSDGRTESRSGLVSSFDGKTWLIANDPQLGAHDKSQNGSFWPAFGDAMAARYHVPIGVAVTGHGGTSIKQWKSGGELFNWTLNRLRQLESASGPGSPGFRALLWHQGESDADAGMAAAIYAEGLGAIIRDMRKQDGRDFPWFVAMASYRPGKPLVAPVTDGQKALWDSHLALEGPNTDAMLGDLRDKGGKGIHFSKKGLKAHGEAWAEKVGAWLDGQLSK